MKRFSTFLLALLALPILAQNEAKIIPSEISAVTIFSQGAQVTRQAQTSLGPGNHTLVFSHLTQEMDPTSVQLEGQGGLTILSIRHQRNYLSDEDKSDKIIALEKDIEKLQRKLEELAAQEQALVMEKQLLDENKKLGGNSGFTLEQLRSTADFVKKRSQENALEKYRLSEQKRELSQQKQKLEKQLQQERQAFSLKTSEIVVKVEASKSTSAQFELSYQVRNASWSTSYDARVNALDEPLKLTQKAIITQQTGEDWENVDLILSTGNPSAGAQIPQMSPWYVGFYQPQNFSNIRGSRSEALQEVAIAADQGATPKMKKQSFQVEDNLTQQEFSINRKQSLYSNAQAETVVLRELELPALYEHQVNPRLDQDAFLIAKVYNWGRFDLQSGEISLYNNATYVGNGYLDASNPADTLELSLGRDKQVIVSRERVYANTEKVFLSKDRIDDFTWRTEIRNQKSTPLTIVLRDQVPVSQNEDIEVKVSDTSGGKLMEKTGIITWNLSLKPGEKQQRTLTYKVRYPQGQRVTYY